MSRSAVSPIWCSDLPNDQDMIRVLQQSVSCLLLQCPLFTDVAFWGFDNSGERIAVGIERKKIGDIVQCMNDGRLLYQAQVAAENGVSFYVVIVEGRLRVGEDGMIEIPVWGINPRTLRRSEVWAQVKPAMTYSRFDQYLTELWRDAGIVVKRTENVRETCAVIRALWDNFQRKDHQSLKQVFKRPAPVVQLVRPSLVRRVACELPGIGWERSGNVARRFSTVYQMVNADLDDWLEIEGIGERTARKVVEALRGGNDAVIAGDKKGGDNGTG